MQQRLFPGGSAQSQPTYPEATDVATIIVEDRYYSDWETVWVQLKWQELPHEFRFTCAERDPLPELWDNLQFKPLEHVSVWLNNALAITGIIITRQTAYDANNHGVSIQGVGLPWFAARASIIPAPDANYEGTIVQIAEKVLAPTGIKVSVVGNPTPIPFKPQHPNTGETMFSFIERLARDRQTILGSDEDGNWLLIGPNNPEIYGDVIEGGTNGNILSAQVTISAVGARDWFYAGGQREADNQTHMAKAAEQQARVKGSLSQYSPLYVTMEHPVWTDPELKERALFEAKWGEGQYIEASITVHGWFNRHSGDIWRPGSIIRVNSPMALLKGTFLGLRSATFQQDRQGGSRTTLDLVSPWKLMMLGFQSVPVQKEPGTDPGTIAVDQAGSANANAKPLTPIEE